jgi:hypothetical protein
MEEFIYSFIYLGSAVKFRYATTNFAPVGVQKPIRFPAIESRAVKLAQKRY